MILQHVLTSVFFHFYVSRDVTVNSLSFHLLPFLWSGACVSWIQLKWQVVRFVNLKKTQQPTSAGFESIAERFYKAVVGGPKDA